MLPRAPGYPPVSSSSPFGSKTVTERDVSLPFRSLQKQKKQQRLHLRGEWDAEVKEEC